MVEMKINVSQITKKFAKSMQDFKKQIPFAISTAINETAKAVKAAELENFRQKLDKPTPYTLRGVGITYAKKSNPEATVFVKDDQAAYLDPYEVGGMSIPAGPGNVAMLVPKGIKLNQYGNIPYQAIKKLLGEKAASYSAKGKMNGTGLPQTKYFFATIQTKSGPISGLWMRTVADNAPRKTYNLNRKTGNFDASQQMRGIKLVMRFEAPRQIKPMLGYQKLAKEVVKKTFKAQLNAAMNNAIKTAKP